MTDVHTREQRSRNMAAIRGRNTKPELRVRSALHAQGLRFRLHRNDLPGKPDIVLPRHQMAIFVHGCFWHSHECKFGMVMPQTRKEFWEDKRKETVRRDSRNQRNLRKQGWHVQTIWECETKSEESLGKLINRLVRRLQVSQLKPNDPPKKTNASSNRGRSA